MEIRGVVMVLIIFAIFAAFLAGAVLFGVVGWVWGNISGFSIGRDYAKREASIAAKPAQAPVDHRWTPLSGHRQNWRDQ